MNSSDPQSCLFGKVVPSYIMHLALHPRLPLVARYSRYPRICGPMTTPLPNVEDAAYNNFKCNLR